MPTWLIKRGLIWLLITAAFAVVAAGVTACTSRPIIVNDQKASDVERAAISVELQGDSSLLITERLTFRYAGSFRGSFRDIPLDSAVQVSDVEVSDSRGDRYTPGASTAFGSYGDEGSFGSERLPQGMRIVWHYRQQDGKRTFTLRYRVRGLTRITRAADAEQAAVIVPWALWGSQWQFRLAALEGRFTADTAGISGSAQPRWVQLSRNDLGAGAERDDRGATITASRLPRETQLAATVAFPRSVVTSTTGAAAIETRAAGERERAAQQARQDSSTVLAIGSVLAALQLPLALLLLASVLGSLIWLVRAARELDPGVPEYLPGPPDDAPPAVGYALAHEGGYSDRLVLATLLDLVNRGLYDATPSAATGDLDLVLSIPISRSAALTKLEPYEQAVLEFFDGLLASPGKLSELKDRVPEHSDTWRTRWETMNTRLDAAETGEIAWDLDHNLTRWRLALPILVLFLIFGGLVGHRTGIYFVPAVGLVAALTMLAVVPAAALKRRDPESTRRGLQWAAFERWTRDFPRLHDDPPATLALWKRILVFGVAFGTAEAVVKSGRIPASVFAEAPGHDWAAPLAYGTMYGSFGPPAAWGSSFSSHVADQSSSSSGGGGFSGGGGGGFSGGGGGGSW